MPKPRNSLQSFGIAVAATAFWLELSLPIEFLAYRKHLQMQWGIHYHNCGLILNLGVMLPALLCPLLLWCIPTRPGRRGEGSTQPTVTSFGRLEFSVWAVLIAFLISTAWWVLIKVVTQFLPGTAGTCTLPGDVFFEARSLFFYLSLIVDIFGGIVAGYLRWRSVRHLDGSKHSGAGMDREDFVWTACILWLVIFHPGMWWMEWRGGIFNYVEAHVTGMFITLLATTLCAIPFLGWLWKWRPSLMIVALLQGVAMSCAAHLLALVVMLPVSLGGLSSFVSEFTILTHGALNFAWGAIVGYLRWRYLKSERQILQHGATASQATQPIA